MTPAISVAALTRRYRGELALDHVTLDLEPGSITGLLGRNGAGKTTFMRILAGHEFASAGTVTVLGANPVENETVLRHRKMLRPMRPNPLMATRTDIPKSPCNLIKSPCDSSKSPYSLFRRVSAASATFSGVIPKCW